MKWRSDGEEWGARIPENQIVTFFTDEDPRAYMIANPWMAIWSSDSEISAVSGVSEIAVVDALISDPRQH